MGFALSAFTPASLLREAPPLSRAALSPQYRWLVVGTVCVGAFLGQLDASIASLVLPTLEEVFHAPVASVEWVAISYLLALAALVVPFGRLADMIGRKSMYTAGFLVFVAGSALCGFATSLEWLIAFRVIQAIGAALLQANSVAIIAAAVSPRELGRAIGIQGAAQAIGLSVGPSVGGLLITALGWRWVFFIAVPFGLIGTVLGWLLLPQTQGVQHRKQGQQAQQAQPALRGATSFSAPQARPRFDWLGAVLFGPVVATALFGLTYANQWGWTSHRLLFTMAIAAGMLVAFTVVELSVAHPLIDFALFRQRVFSAGIASGLLSYAVLFGTLFLAPFFLQRVRGLSTVETGMLLSPVPLALGIVAPFSGTIADRIGSRIPTVVGMALASIALLTLAAAPGAPLAFIALMLALLGAGLGLFTPPHNSAVMASAPVDRLGTAGGILNMTRSLGTSLGVALTGAIMAISLNAQMGEHVERTLDVPLPVLAHAVTMTLLFASVLSAFSAIISSVRGTQTVADPTAGHSANAGDQATRELLAAEAGGA